MQTPDLKIVAALAVAALAVVSAFLALNPDTGISGFFSAGGAQQENISFTATFDKTPFNINTEAFRVALTLPKDSKGLLVNGQALDLSALNEVEVVFIEWNGKVDFDKELLLSGTAKKVIVNNIGIGQDGKLQGISAKDLKFNSAKLYGVSANVLSVEKAVGSVSVANGKTQIKVESEPVEVENFKGDISFDGGIKLDGTADNVLVSGKNKVSVG